MTSSDTCLEDSGMESRSIFQIGHLCLIRYLQKNIIKLRTTEARAFDYHILGRTLLGSGYKILEGIKYFRKSRISELGSEQT
jgi:hypothetical protein